MGRTAPSGHGEKLQEEISAQAPAVLNPSCPQPATPPGLILTPTPAALKASALLLARPLPQLAPLWATPHPNSPLQPFPCTALGPQCENVCPLSRTREPRPGPGHRRREREAGRAGRPEGQELGPVGGRGQAVLARVCSTIPGTALTRATWLSGAAALTADTAQGKGALSPSLVLPLNQGALRAGPRIDGVSPGLDATICLRGWAACSFCSRASQPQHEFVLSTLGRDSRLALLASQPLQDNRRPGQASSPRMPLNAF